ncbi:hypothetical protein [Novipirellula sp.]|uniref:hypothetical protein n=1 Tax=Novipirellula sp. TaxID=2795430 RepID=UPI00356833F4
MANTTDIPVALSDTEPRALLSQLNWLRVSTDETKTPIYEYPLFSDAHLTGEVNEGLGPYSFLNAVPISNGPGVVNAPIVLRAVYYLGNCLPDMSKTDESLYHGGTLVDEIAALASLALGIRVRAGGETRRFEPGQDPYGRPCAWNDEPRPVIRVRRNHLVLPSVTGTHSMDPLEILKSVPLIAPDRYVNLIRACKSYQDALWVAESEPNLAWLMLVSALETAANDVYTTESTADERLRDSKPDLASLLEQHGGTQLVNQVADMISHTFGATKKFIDFTMCFMPDEPENRPEQEWMRVKWSKTSLKKVLNTVYEYRSRSLHAGLPFPAPMFEAPFKIAADSSLSDVPMTGLASHSRGGTWMPKDTRINLHGFHYITRGVLLNWWQSIQNDR